MSHRQDVLFNFMDLLLKAGPAGIVVNSALARLHHWKSGSMHQVLRSLCSKKIVICTEAGQNKRAALPVGIRSHQDWILDYFKGKEVPKKYHGYITVQAPSKIVKAKTPRETVIEQLRNLVEVAEREMAKLEAEKAVSDLLLFQKEERIKELEAKLERARAYLNGQK